MSLIANKCEICATNDHKYKCPRCSMKTCSLVCCRTHKSNTGCTGERDKTKYIPKDQFDEKILLSDYKYLEEQTRLIDSFQRTVEQFESPFNTNGNKIIAKQIPHGAFENLKKFVKTQFNICLKIMPSQSTRHINNKTRFNRATNAISWSMEFVFHLDQTKIESTLKNCLFRFHTKSCLFSSSETLKNILIQFYNKFKSDLFENIEETEASSSIDSICLIKTFSNLIQGESFDGLNVLFEINDFYLKKKYFIKFDLNKKLDDCLRNRTLIEYPTLYLVTHENLHNYLIEENSENIKDDLNNEEEELVDQNEEENSNAESDSDKSSNDSNEIIHNNEASLKNKINIEPDNHIDEQNSNKKMKTESFLPKKSEDYEIEEGEEIDSD